MNDSPDEHGLPELPDELKETLAQARAAIDAAIVSMPDQARLLGGYYKGLVDEGFPEDAALQLTANFQMFMLSQGVDEE